MPVDRVSAGDLTQLATDVGPVPMNVRAVLLVDGADPAAVRAALLDRLLAVPRFRQRLHRAPPGLGRPYWADVDVDPAHHVRSVRLAGTADDGTLAAVGANEVTRPLDRRRPLWRATFVHDDRGLVAVTLVLHHVLADGIGGLAVLRGLADPEDADRTARPAPRPAPGPGARPSLGQLAVDAWTARLRAARALPDHLATVRRGRAELRTGRARRSPAPPTRFNAPTGSRRTVHLAAVPLADLRTAARRHGATVNDALLVAIATTLGRLSGSPGAVEDAAGAGRPPTPAPQSVIVSVPVAARAATTGGELGNQVGVMPVRVAVGGDTTERLVAVAAETGARKHHRGASAAVVGPLFRGLAAVGAFRWMIDRQRLVTTFLTNLPGPPTRLRLGGAAVRRVVPVTITAGNVGVAFAALSYAGELGVTVITDPDVVPDGDAVARGLAAELARLAEGAATDL